MTAPDLDAIRARAEAATVATWRSCPAVEIHEPGYEVYRAPADGGLYGSEGTVGWTCSHADAEFIAHAREGVPALLAEVKRLRNEVVLEASNISVAQRQRHEAQDRARKAEAQVQAVRALADEWEREGVGSHYGAQRQLRAALDTGSTS